MNFIWGRCHYRCLGRYGFPVFLRRLGVWRWKEGWVAAKLFGRYVSSEVSSINGNVSSQVEGKSGLLCTCNTVQVGSFVLLWPMNHEPSSIVIQMRPIAI